MIKRRKESQKRKCRWSNTRFTANKMDVRREIQGLIAFMMVMSVMAVALAGCASSGGTGDTADAGAAGSMSGSSTADSIADSRVTGSSIEDSGAAGSTVDSGTIGWEPIPEDDPARQRGEAAGQSDAEQHDQADVSRTDTGEEADLAGAGQTEESADMKEADEATSDESMSTESMSTEAGAADDGQAGEETKDASLVGGQEMAAAGESTAQAATGSQETAAAGNQNTSQGAAGSQSTVAVQGHAGESSDAALVSLMQTFMDNYGLNASNFAVAYKNLSTGTTYYFNELKQWDACSTYKLPLNLLYYDMQAAGEITADTIIPGTNTPLSECHHQSLEFSNNPLSEAMMNNLGSYDKVKQQMRKYFTLTDAETDSSYYHHNYFCARQMMDCAQYLYNHQSEYQEALGYLEAAQPGQYFRRYLPADVTIAQKYGLRDGYNHNAGIIFGSTPFVLSIYSYQAGGDEMIARCAEALYQYTES